MRIREIAQARVRYGYRKIRVLLNREGWEVGKYLVYRLYKEEGLTLKRMKPAGKRKAVRHREERFKATGPDQAWSMDFVADQLQDGTRFRSLTIVDVYTREAVVIEAGQSLKGDDVVRTLNRLRLERGVPKVLFCDNGSEFTSQAMDLWAYRNGAKIDFSRPGKPTDNAFVESFNGTFRAECLDTHWFADLKEAKQLIEAWRQEYNESRSHRSLGDRTPSETPARSRLAGSGCNLNRSQTNAELGTGKLGPSSYQSSLYTVEPNHRQVFSVSPWGQVQQVIDISASQGHIVPTSLVFTQGVLYVGNLNLFPIDPQWAKVMTIANNVYAPNPLPDSATCWAAMDSGIL